MERLWHKAKAFIGLEDDEDFGHEMVGTAVAQEQPSSGLSRFRSKKPNPIHADFEVVIYEPKVYEDSLPISTRLRQGNPVIINLRHLDPDDGTRLIDFVCGTAYAIDGHMMRVGESIFLFTPNNIAISSLEDKSLENVAEVIKDTPFVK